MPPTHRSSPLFSHAMHHQAVAALFLIENSQAMMTMWSDLRDYFLQDVMTRLSVSNPAAPITTLVSGSLPTNDTAFTAAPRQYSTLQSGLLDLRFNWDPKNRFSVETIWRYVDYLAATDMYGMPAVRHLVIVAASPPFDDTIGADPTCYSGSSRWHQLALKITQANIQCHLVLSPNQDMRSLVVLFEETLRLQNAVEESPSFPVDRTNMICRLSTGPQFYSASANSFPPPNHVNVDDSMYGLTSPSEPENPPSLVAQLQQVHGLTKKKVYGTKPVHTPFVREDRVHKEPPCAPAPLILPSVQSTGGGRAVSTSKASRISRMAQSSPTELQARRPGFPRRNSRLSSPETDSYSSPTSYTTPSNIPSPVSPTSLVNIYKQSAPTASSQAETSLDPSWGTTEYKSHVSSLSQPSLSPSQFPTPVSSRPLADPWQNNNINISEPIVPSAVTEPIQSPVCYTSSSRLVGPTDNRRMSSGADDAPSQSLPRRSCSSDDEPFTFSAEYVAATATMFKNEVLPAYPELQSAFPEVISPRHAFFVAQDQSSTPSPESSYDPGELYISAEREEIRQQSFSQTMKQPAPGSNSPGLSCGATSYSPGSSSSLTGWAG
ncbi:hypothetical protein J132_08141 [Termitomyces sp. J132]|nr:hypothetical protein J132_08141 [Termitomyces sp. J132]